MNTIETISINYTVKNKDGYIEDKQQLFHTTKAAYTFLKTLKRNMLVVGTPVLEVKNC